MKVFRDSDMIEKLKFHLCLIVAVLFSSCSSKPELIKFDDRLLSLSYPKSWITHEYPNQLFSISKYGKFNAMIFKYNPNLSVYVDDTVSLFEYYGSYNFIDFYERLKKDNLENKNTSFLNEFVFTKNNTEIKVIALKISNKSKNYLQILYCFESFENFVTIVCNDNYSEPNQELQSIIASLEIPENKQVIELLPEVVLQ